MPVELRPGNGTDLRPPVAARPLDLLAAEYYPQLLAIARRERRRAGGAATLDTRAVLHEAFIRLAEQRKARWDDRGHFFAAAAATMRRVLIDHVRRRHARKRGGAPQPVTLDDRAGLVDARDESLIALDEALIRLAEFAPRLARVVEYRYFAGMTEGEMAEVLGVTERTVHRDWIKARGWLHAVLGGEA